MKTNAQRHIFNNQQNKVVAEVTRNTAASETPWTLAVNFAAVFQSAEKILSFTLVQHLVALHSGQKAEAPNHYFLQELL
ncbi:MAG: hypothetical protein EOO10_25600 [Chitinophagaceae bacterium]|nr:MAG: hypothetical protein EOO10_25600 [Chitinophagaceae bacterium]